jgi:hypothetical protein
MSIGTVLVLVALAASILLVLQSQSRLFPVIAVVASGIEALFVFKLITVRVKGLDIWLVLGIAMVVAGTLCWLKSSGRNEVTAATVVTFVGAIQVLQVLLR